MTDTKDLVARLRMRGVFDPAHVDNAAADALEAQDKRIAGLEALAQGRLEQMEADRKQALVWRDENAALKAEISALRAQKPVAFSRGNTLYWHPGAGVTNAQLFESPIAKPATAKVYDPLPSGKV